MDRTRILCGAVGAAVVLLFSSYVAAPARQAPSSHSELPTIPSSPGMTQAPVAPMPPPPPKDKGIEELLASLDVIKARKAELEKAEKETVAILREKLRQQRQRLQKHGIIEEEQQPVPGTAPVVPQSYSSGN